MQQATLRCSYCGLRTSVHLDETALRTLHSQNFMARVCTACGGTTKWELVVTADRLRREEAGESGPRVLLIDDDQSILQVIGKALSASGCDVQAAASARDAGMLLTRNDYDVIISDIRMPGFDGTQLFAFLEQHLPEYGKRVIFLTGDTGNPATMEFLEKTGAPYLTKPIAIPELLDLVRTVAAQAGSAGLGAG